MDVEQFIELVKERPCLYDKDALNKTRIEKDQKWKEIALAMDITIEVAKSKWKNLKDNYAKHLKGTTVTSGYQLRYLHWAWAPNMEFMMKHLNFAGNTSNPDYNTHQDEEAENIELSSSTKSDDRSEDLPVDIRDYSIKRRHKNISREGKLTPSTHKVFHYIQNEDDDGYDATDLIFLGYAKAIKSFSIRRQAEVKFKIAKIIMEEEVADYEDNAIYNPRPTFNHSPSSQIEQLNSKVPLEIQVKNEEP